MTPPDRRWTMGLAAALVGTVAIGAWLRWALVGVVALPAPFGDLRHAHSHLGYYGLLFPLAWLGWAAAGARAPGRRLLAVYVFGTALATVGFVVDGYGPIAIAGSTLVAALWLVSAAPLVRRMTHLHDPLGAVPLGLAASLACVPPVAMYLRTDPALAQGFVSTFLSGLLLVVVIPSTLAGRGISPGPWPLLLIAGGLGAAALGVAPSVLTRVGLLVFAGLLLTPVFARRVETHARLVWLPVAAGMAAIAAGLLPNTRPVALGAIHFVVLGPVMAMLAPRWLPRPPGAAMWWSGHALWGVMSGALVAQAFVPDRWTWVVAAIGGTGTALWWVVVLVRQARAAESAGDAEAEVVVAAE